MKFEWDETKRISNIDKHKIDFVDVPMIFEGDIAILDDFTRLRRVKSSTRDSLHLANNSN